MGGNTLEVRRIHRRNFLKITIIVCLYVIDPDRDIGLITSIERLRNTITEVLHTDDHLGSMVTRQSAHTE
jgi:hypothetical protein